MSLHNQSYLVSSHQSDMHRHAAEQRLVAKERKIVVEPTTLDAPAEVPASTAIRRLVIQLSAAMKPLRRLGFTPRI